MRCVVALLSLIAMLGTGHATPALGVRSMTLAPTPAGAGLVLELDVAARVRGFAIAGERPRLVLDLPAATFPGAAGARLNGVAPGAGPVAQLRYARRTADASRIVLDLAEPATLAEIAHDPLPGGGVRVRVAVSAAGATPAHAHDILAPEPPASAPPPPAPRPRRRTVVVDAGHGGKDPGAIGANGVREKDVNLAAALALRAELQARGFDVALTREGDSFIELFDRVATARAAGADLFISIHADASRDPASAGASIYTLSETGGRRALTIAGRQNWELELEDPPRSELVRSILLDLAQRDTKNRSAAFAEAAIEALSPVAPLLRNTHRNAGFAVLLAPDVPAVLLEMGFLTNPTDERRLADPGERAKMMRALAGAVERYFAEPSELASR